MQPSFGSGSTDSPMRGTCACWPTPDADLSCGSQSFVDNRSSTTQILNYLPRANHDRSRSRTRPGTKKERGREGGAHPVRGQGRNRTTPTGTQVCFAFNTAADGCATVYTTSRAHVCEFCLEPHRTVECPRHPGWTPPAKGAGKGKGKNKGKK